MSFKGRLDCIITIYNDIKEQNKKINYAKLFCIASVKQHNYNFTIF